jgi:hypothetical protein
MQHSFSYEKNKVIQGVRYHFVQDRAIKLLVILINIKKQQHLKIALPFYLRICR